MNKTGGQLETKLHISGNRRMGLAVYDKSRQPIVSNGCQSNNGGCSFLCLLKPNGYTCECENGTILGSDNKTCGAPVYCPQFVPKPNTVTVTSCKTSVGSQCSFKCRNGYSLTSGSAVVTCLSNGVWSSGGPSCKAHSCQQPCLLVSNTTNILTVQAASLANQQPVSIISNLSRAVAIDVHINRNLIFWSDVTNKNIKRANVDGSNIVTIVQDRAGVIDGLAVEWTTSLLYWTDTTFDKIEVAHLDGSRRKVLIKDNLDEPRGIAVDPQAGLIFWTDWGATPKIECAYLNGENRHAVVSSSLGWPNDITLDHSTQKMYWVDAKTDKIEYADYTGFNRGPLFHQAGIHPFGVDIYSSWLYWTDWATISGLHQMDKSSGALNSKAQVSGRRMGLVVMDSSKQPSSSNGCQTNNGGCEFLCLLKPNGYVCVCPYGKVLKADGKTCKIPASGCQQPCLYLSNTTHILAASASLTHHPIDVISNLTRAVALDIHIDRRFIFWSDVINKTIKRANVDGSNIVTIVQDRAGVIDGLAVEWTTSLLYWTDTTFDKIEVAHLDGSRRKVLIKDNLDEPRGIAVDPRAGFMYWTDWGTIPKIERAYLNGQSRSTIVSSSLGWPNDISLDHSTQKIYWVDAKTDTIETSDYNGANRRIISTLAGIHPFGVAIYGPWLYWTDWNTVSGLHKMNKTGGQLETKLHISGNRRMGLAVYDKSRQPIVSNGCQSNNGGCSFLCLLKPNGYTCECGNGTILGSDNKTCGAPVYCPQFVPKPNTVTVTSCKTSVGSQCSFKCRNGYSLSSGSAVVTCLLNGVWSSGGPSCKDSEPPVFTSCPRNMFKYAAKDKKALVTWSTPNATDNSGMPPNVAISLGPSPPVRLVEGVNHVTYTAVDQAKNKAVCSFTIKVTVIYCTMPTPSGVLQKDRCENHYGGTCNFTCPYGYRMVGVATLNCLATNGGPPGVWDRQLPRCEAIICPVPPTPANAVKANCNGQVSESVGTVCQFTCMHGFQPSAVQTRTCLANGTWSGTPLVCYSVACHPLIKPKFGSLAPSTCLNGGKYNDICYLTCRNGFNIKGTTARTCGSNGRWTGLNDTQCEDDMPPTFNNTCPVDQILNLGSCASNITVSWIPPVASDNSGSVTVQRPSLQPPVILSDGIYTLNYTAEDAAGNSRSCVFKIQITRRSCRNLSPPLNGVIASMTCINYYGSVAVIGCKPGYSINGPYTRTCTSNGQWSGVSTTCTQIICQPPPPLKFGIIEPSKCTTGLPVVSGTFCLFKCNISNGFKNVGAAQSTCTINGTWSEDVTKIHCKDVQRPVLSCPNDKTINTDAGKPYATYSWTLPVPQDNSGEKLTLTVNGGISPPYPFNVGDTFVRYSTKDSAGLEASCRFKVTVQDKEPPKNVTCPAKKEIKSAKRFTKVSFPKAVFSDNVGVTHIVTNRVNGSKLTWGKYDIIYTAYDKAGNKGTCTMKLLVIGTSICKRPAPPSNGGIACDNQLVSMFCTLHCNPGYIFAVTPKPPKLLICDPNGKWGSKKKPHIPDCTGKTTAQINIGVNLSYLISKCSEHKSNEIKNKFLNIVESMIKHLMTDYCKLGLCKLDNIYVKCGKTDDKRRKRSVDKQETLEIDFQVKIPFPENTTSNINTTLKDVQTSVFETINSSASSLEVNGVRLTLAKAPSLSFVGLSCAEGEVLKGASCAGCPPGYFFESSSKTCAQCPVDHYQSEEGKTSCMACPSGTSTSKETGSKTCSKAEIKKSSVPRKALSTVVIPVVVALVVVIVVAVIAFFLYRRFRHPRSRTSRADSDMQNVVDRPQGANYIEMDNPLYISSPSQDHLYETIGDQKPAVYMSMDGATPNMNVDGASNRPNMNVDGPKLYMNVDGTSPNMKVDGATPNINVDGATPKMNVDGASNRNVNVDGAKPNMNVDGAKAYMNVGYARENMSERSKNNIEGFMAESVA